MPGNRWNGIEVWDKEHLLSGNLIVGNEQSGIYLNGAVDCTIVSNRIGVLEDDTPAPNHEHGIRIANNSTGNVIGNELLDDPRNIANQRGCNIIAADDDHHAILIDGDIDWDPNAIGPMGLLIQGNELWGGMRQAAIRVEKVGKNGGEPIRIGGQQAERANLILEGLIGIDLFEARHVRMGHNRIGFNPGEPEQQSEYMDYGVHVENCAEMDIGIDGWVAVGGCKQGGIHITGSKNIRSQHLRLGVLEDDVAFGGYADVGIAGCAVKVIRSTNVTVGAAGATSLIANNAESVRVEESRNVGLHALHIGLQTDLLKMTNDSVGIWLWQVDQAVLGDAAFGEDAINVVGGCPDHGIVIEHSRNIALGMNRVGVSADGSLAFANIGHGLAIYNSSNVVVGAEPGSANVFSGNAGCGVFVTNYTPYANALTLQRSYIGVTADGTSILSNRLDGVRIHGSAGNRIGGAQSEGNVISGNLGVGVRVSFTSSVANVISGNLIGLNAAGNAALPNRLGGILIEEAGATVVGGGGAFGNVISGNWNDGLRIHGANSGNAVISGNYIGLNAAGGAAIPNQFDGIVVVDAPNVVIGGDDTQAANTISGNLGYGIVISNSAPPYVAADNVTIARNLIGTDRFGETLIGNQAGGVYLRRVDNATLHANTIMGNQGGGVTISHGNDHRIGTGTAAAANTIAYQGGHGIWVQNGERNAILGNSFYLNHGQGIRLGTQEFSYAESPGAPNRHQRQPEITSAFRGSTHIHGLLETAPEQEYVVEFYLTESTNHVGFGEGETLLIATNLITDALGQAPFAIVLPQTEPLGWIITATATDPFGNTSTFSPFVEIGEAPDTHGYGVPDFYQEQYGLVYTEPGEAHTRDSDGDGVSDHDEWLAGTDPTNPDSVFEVRFGSIHIPDSSPGRLYTLEASTHLPSGVWFTVDQSLGTGGLLEFDDSPMDDEFLGIYRVKAAMP